MEPKPNDADVPLAPHNVHKPALGQKKTVQGGLQPSDASAIQCHPQPRAAWEPQKGSDQIGKAFDSRPWKESSAQAPRCPGVVCTWCCRRGPFGIRVLRIRNSNGQSLELEFGCVLSAWIRHSSHSRLWATFQESQGSQEETEAWIPDGNPRVRILDSYRPFDASHSKFVMS